MAFGNSTDAVFKLNGTPVTSYLTGVDPTFTANLAELKTLGNHFVQQLYGHRIASFSNDGVFEPALDSVLWQSWHDGTPLTWDWYPQGEGTGKVHYSGSALIPEYKPGVASQDAEVKEPFQLKSTGDVTRVA